MPDVTPAGLGLNPIDSYDGTGAVQSHGNRYEPASSRIALGAFTLMKGEDREAILASLYDERSRLLRAKRLRQLSANDEEYLRELNQYIDEREAPEILPREKDDVWAKIDALASRLLTIQTEISRTKT